MISCSLGNYTFLMQIEKEMGSMYKRPSVKDFLEDGDLSIMQKEQW